MQAKTALAGSQQLHAGLQQGMFRVHTFAPCKPFTRDCRTHSILDPAATKTKAKLTAPPKRPAAPPPPPKVEASQPGQPWPEERLRQMQASGEVVEARIESVNKGGAKIRVEGASGFIPYRRLSAARLRPGTADMSYLVGQSVRAKIVELDASADKKVLVLSENAVLVQDALAALQPGQVVEGSVSRITDTGAVVTLTSVAPELGITALIKKQELSWDVVMTVEEVIATGQQVQAQVVAVDLATSRVSLSLRQLQPDPLQQTIEAVDWSSTSLDEDSVPEFQSIMAQLRKEPGVVGVRPGRRAEEKHTVSQDIELYLTKKVVDDGFDVVARIGRELQELHVSTSLSRDEMKAAVRRVIKRVVALDGL